MTQPPVQTSAELRTEHYDLYVEGLDVNEVASMIEQLHGQLRTYFSAEPEGRLPVGVYATRQRWAAALQADHQFVPAEAGGYYAPGNHKVYMWLQPSAYFTRQVLLHELTHQFHWLVATGNQAPSALWYTEGIAEYFGMHNWDGHHLVTCVIPAVTLEDYPSTALKKFEVAGCDLARMLVAADRPESWALVHFLQNRHGEQFRRLSRKLDNRDNAAEAWKEVFGGDTSRLSQEFHTWLTGHAQPWQIVWVSWQQAGEALESESKFNAITILKETPKTLSVEVERLGTAGAAGMVFAYRSVKDFYLLQVIEDGKVRVMRRQNDQWTPVFMEDCPGARVRNVLSVTQDGASTTLWANGVKVTTIQAAGQVGLNVDGCRARFWPKEL